LRLTYVGHATLLLEVGGVTVLTDPNLASRLGGVLPRVSPPAVVRQALAGVDAVLVTHGHADHLSVAGLEVLGRPRRVPMYAPPGVARWLARRGPFDARPVQPGDELAVRPSAPRLRPPAGHAAVYVGAAAHTGSRYGVDRWGGRSASNTYLIDSGNLSVFFAGDTGLTPESHALVERVLAPAGRRLDVALLPIGYAPWWKPRFRRGHLSGADALALFDRLNARYLITYHWGTFHHLTSGPFDAIRQMEPALAHHPRRDAVRVIHPGGSLVIDAERG